MTVLLLLFFSLLCELDFVILKVQNALQGASKSCCYPSLVLAKSG